MIRSSQEGVEEGNEWHILRQEWISNKSSRNSGYKFSPKLRKLELVMENTRSSKN